MFLKPKSIENIHNQRGSTLVYLNVNDEAAAVSPQGSPDKEGK